MSDVGRYSGLYALVSESGRLLDRVLIRLREGSSRPSDSERLELSRLLSEIGTQRSDRLSSQVLEAILEKNAFKHAGSMEKVSTALKEETVAPQLVEWLEDLAQLLERERATLMHRIRGHSP